MGEQQKDALDKVFEELQKHKEIHIETRCINEEERKRNRVEFEALKKKTYETFGSECPETNWML